MQRWGGGQFRSCATVEPEIEGTWHKFMNNDGLEIGEGHKSFRSKALAFAHWIFHRFGGKLLVCDLQGKKKFLDSHKCKLGAYTINRQRNSVVITVE